MVIQNGEQGFDEWQIRRLTSERLPSFGFERRDPLLRSSELRVEVGPSALDECLNSGSQRISKQTQPSKSFVPE